MERCLMNKQRRTFSPEFKLQAACLVLDQGYSHVEASRSVGIGESVLRRWVQQLQLERQGAPPPGKAITPDQQRIQGNHPLFNGRYPRVIIPLLMDSRSRRQGF
jgi:hypothetical protein